MNDKELVRLYVSGTDAALAELLSRYKDKIYRSILLFVKNSAEAEDLFQDTFVRIIDCLRKGAYNDEGKFLPWAMRIARNLCIDHYRKEKRMPAIVNNEGFDIFEILKFADESADDTLMREQTRLSVRELIDALPEEQRDVLILRHYADLSFKEIAAMTNVNVNTLLGRMRYALLNMRKLIEEKKVAL